MSNNPHLQSFSFELTVYAPASFSSSDITRNLIQNPPAYCKSFARQESRFGDALAWLWNPSNTSTQEYNLTMEQDGWLPLDQHNDSHTQEQEFHYNPIPIRIYLGESLLPLVQDEHLTSQIQSIKEHIQQAIGLESPPLEILDNLNGPSHQVVAELPTGEHAQTVMYLDKIFVTGPASSLSSLDEPLQRTRFLPYPGKWVNPETAKELSDHPYPIIGAWVFLEHFILNLAFKHQASLMTTDRLAEHLTKLELVAPVLTHPILNDPQKLSYVRNLAIRLIEQNIQLHPWLPLLETCSSLNFHGSIELGSYAFYRAQPLRFWNPLLEEEQLPVWSYDPKKFLASPILTPHPESYLLATLAEATRSQPKATVVIIPNTWEKAAENLQSLLEGDFLLTPERLLQRHQVPLLHLGSLGALPPKDSQPQASPPNKTQPVQEEETETKPWFHSWLKLQ